jgi:hypothetical protein
MHGIGGDGQGLKLCGVEDALTGRRESLAPEMLEVMSLDLSALYIWNGVSWYHGILYKQSSGSYIRDESFHARVNRSLPATHAPL